MKYTTITILLLPALLWAQDLQFQLETDSISVVMEGWIPYSPWAGGVSTSNPTISDLDADGDLDFMIGTFYGNIISFQNGGNSTQPLFFFNPEISSGIQTIGWAAPDLCDIDNDGDLDLFATSDERVWFWENIGTPQVPQWQFITDSLEQITWWAINMDFVDIDADGDLDLFTGDGIGTIRFYRNQGTPFNAILVPEAYMVSNIDVGDASDPGFVDIDQDGDYDLFIGNTEGRIWYYRNDGDSANYDFMYVTNFFDSIDVGGYSSPEFADIDGDGDYDMFVGKEANTSSPLGDVYFYENVGTAQEAQFQLAAKNYLMLDVGYNPSRVQVVDINADQARDLFIGSSNNLVYFENMGDSIEAQLELVDQAFQGILLTGITPYFVDIDADGDQDLICGQGAIPGPPSIALYLNEGTPRMPQFVLYSAQFVTNSNFVVQLYPGIADIDADGDYDLFVSDNGGHFFYYQNNGTPQWPNFVPMSSQWQGIQFPYPNNGARGFCFSDLDEDGDLDLLMMNSAQTNLLFYRNTGTSQNATMTLETEEFIPEFSFLGALPFLTDIDSDSDNDLFVGNYNNGVYFFRNITGEVSVPPPVERHPQAGLQISLGPNPANPITVISCQLPVPSQISLEVFDISGRKLVELASGFHLPGEYRYVWDASGRAAGMYFIRLKTPQESFSEKLTIVK